MEFEIDVASLATNDAQVVYSKCATCQEDVKIVEACALGNAHRLRQLLRIATSGKSDPAAVSNI